MAARMIGEILDGKYRIDRHLGAGGMGSVYLATHLGTTRVVAVKVIASQWAAEPQFLARFQREARACGRLRHPNIVNVTDFGIAPFRGGQIAYLVMELLDGETLSSFQQSQPQPPLPLVADLLDQIGLALDEAHRHGIIHRDLKPDNIWLERTGRGAYNVKMLDFGVAKLNGPADPLPPPLAPGSTAPASVTPKPPTRGDEMETIVFAPPPVVTPAPATPSSDDAATIAMPQLPSDPPGSFGVSAFGVNTGHTMPGSLVGTPAYMSPEQAFGEDVDFRSDIYSMAVVAYSLVCGALPFSGKTSELIAFHRSGKPKPPSSIAKTPRDVSDTVLAGLARDPAARPPSASAFARRFHNAVDAEFLALRRSKTFLFRRMLAFMILLMPLYSALVGIIAIANAIFGAIHVPRLLETALDSVAAALLLVFADNVFRAAAALIALEERARRRRFVGFRAGWRLLKWLPALAKTQARSLFAVGPGWVIGDCLWPVVCVVENLRGKVALLRSRELMTGLKSAGLALAVRHLSIAVLAIGDLVGVLSLQSKHGRGVNTTSSSLWFPIFTLFAAAPLYLYDRTAAREDEPLLQLDRTPELRFTTRPLTLSSTIWVVLAAIYLLYEPVKLWLAGPK